MNLFWEHLLNHTFPSVRHPGGLLASVACGVVGSLRGGSPDNLRGRRDCPLRARGHGGGALPATRPRHRVDDAALWSERSRRWSRRLIIAAVTLSGRQREDTVLSPIWAIGMAVGISFITATPGYYEDLMSYLFGNILMVGVNPTSGT
jgi:zinc transport system permease protein